MQLNNPEGKYKALEKYSRDELVKYLEQLQEARVEAEKAKKSNSSFMSIAHGLSNPLSAIVGYNEVIYEDAVAAGYDDFLPNLKKIKLEGLYLLEMISKILDISRIEAGRVALYLQSIEVNKLIEDVVDIAKNLTEKNRNTFKLLLGENLGTIYAERPRVKEVLRIILDNAANFTKDGLITLSVERVNNQKQGIQNQNAESLNNADNYIVFRVIDTGIGMTEEQLKHIFKPFTQADGGTSLGLAICHGWCEIMGAKIDVESEYGEGSTFSVWFPERMMNERLSFGNNEQDLKLDEAKLQETISQVIGNQKVTEKNLERKN
ncbi:MAG: HAMP domain-containing histidine kinase [Okeania sp. SIO3I5]|uniref:sensor histidine kinase n=1 Tax=Okeania sp. SIO3I5 TaxID=2607805 RepID=UPI0013B86D99|nr:HAMP domain-containing sensor histidine kinase [Okeania sp. SIO3I5]NEQ37107.1 HAMP domain-containing histidine kinase [Okeania sp. SIO3I5]